MDKINNGINMVSDIGKYVVVRGTDSGLFAGTLLEKQGKEVRLGNVRKLHYYDGAGAIEQIAIDGVSKPDNCRFTVFVAEAVVTDAIQIIPTTEKAEKIIKGVKEWKA